MTAAEPWIVVIERSAERGENLKALIEFMDAPNVQVANAADWMADIRDRRVAAVFIGDSLGPDAIDQVIREVGQHDPNTAIVRVTSEGDFLSAD